MSDLIGERVCFFGDKTQIYYEGIIRGIYSERNGDRENVFAYIEVCQSDTPDFDPIAPHRLVQVLLGKISIISR